MARVFSSDAAVGPALRSLDVGELGLDPPRRAFPRAMNRGVLLGPVTPDLDEGVVAVDLRRHQLGPEFQAEAAFGEHLVRLVAPSLPLARAVGPLLEVAARMRSQEAVRVAHGTRILRARLHLLHEETDRPFGRRVGRGASAAERQQREERETADHFARLPSPITLRTSRIVSSARRRAFAAPSPTACRT